MHVCVDLLIENMPFRQNNSLMQFKNTNRLTSVPTGSYCSFEYQEVRFWNLERVESGF